MRKNKITTGIPNSGRKKEFTEPVLVSFKVEKATREDVQSRHGNKVSEKLREFFNKL